MTIVAGVNVIKSVDLNVGDRIYDNNSVSRTRGMIGKIHQIDSSGISVIWGNRLYGSRYPLYRFYRLLKQNVYQVIPTAIEKLDEIL